MAGDTAAFPVGSVFPSSAHFASAVVPPLAVHWPDCAGPTVGVCKEKTTKDVPSECIRNIPCYVSYHLNCH